MPLPTPRGDETEADFVSRCMRATADEFPDDAQRTAVCHRQWREAKKGEGSGKRSKYRRRRKALLADLIEALGLGTVEEDEEAEAKAEGGDEPQKVEYAVAFKAAEPELRVVYGEVFAPGYVDSHGDTMRANAVRKMAWEFLASGYVNKIDVKHDGSDCGAVVVESYLARDGDPMFNPGAWVLGVHVPDEHLWHAIKGGDLNGFSLEAMVRRREVEVDMLVPDQLAIKTEPSEDHAHDATLYFDEEGDLRGGRTAKAAGHYHEITGGSRTGPARKVDGTLLDEHTHRIHYVQELVRLQPDLEAQLAHEG